MKFTPLYYTPTKAGQIQPYKTDAFLRPMVVGYEHVHKIPFVGFRYSLPRPAKEHYRKVCQVHTTVYINIRFCTISPPVKKEYRKVG